MDFRRSSRKSLLKPVNILHESYPHVLQLYKEPPTFEICYSEFEESAAERLAALQTIDEVNSRGLKGKEWRMAIIDELRKQDMKSFCKLITATSSESEQADYIMRRRDHISHFVLRLAYCDREDKRRWFIAREIDLFRFRWQYLTTSGKAEFLKLNNLNYEMISEAERKELADLSYGMIMTGLEYYKVPFTFVSELVKARLVFLQNGFAFITPEDIISVIMTSFRADLAQSLAYASRRIQILDEDERIAVILKGASKMKREIMYNICNDKNTIDIRNLDALAEMSYPLCMQELHGKLRTDHHLRHSARQQYGLFLKGIGVTLEDSLAFWRQEFTKKMDVDKFEKSYSYNIRHNYGKEGKRANYAPHNCMKIIMESVGPGEQHGCPFRHADPVSMKKILSKNGLSLIGVQEVIDLMKKGQYQIACGKYFALKHNCDPVAINHPNIYFDLSQNYFSGKGLKKEEPGSSQTSNAPISTAGTALDGWGDDSFNLAAMEIES